MKQITWVWFGVLLATAALGGPACNRTRDETHLLVADAALFPTEAVAAPVTASTPTVEASALQPGNPSCSAENAGSSCVASGAGTCECAAPNWPAPVVMTQDVSRPGSLPMSPEEPATVPQPEPPSPPFGAACTDDSGCAVGLTCDRARPEAGMAGPAGGYCTFACTTSADCRERDATARCVANRCRGGCSLGLPAPGEQKCGGRELVACVAPALVARQGVPAGEEQLNTYACLPRCRSDADCPDMSCDPASGSCLSELPGGSPDGATCRTHEECAGTVCARMGEGYACASPCRFGPAGCGFAPGQRAEASCLYRRANTQAEGDISFCVELCDSPADCTQPGSGCEPLPRPVGERTGRCILPRRAELGERCTHTNDCRPGLGCNLAVPGGHCSALCGAPTPAGDAICERVAPGSLCSPERACVLPCRVGWPGEVQCLGRSDLVCVYEGWLARLGEDGENPAYADGQRGLCVSHCASDAVCRAGYVCDRSFGTCVPPENLRGGAPNGAPCSVSRNCAGRVCWSFGDRDAAMCTSMCSYLNDGCGYADDDPFPQEDCVTPQLAGSVRGDAGFCRELCDTAADCEHPRATCVASEMPLRGGRRGLCVGPEVPLTPAADAGPPGPDAG